MTTAAPGSFGLGAGGFDVPPLPGLDAPWLAAGESDISPVGVPEPARPIRESSKDRSSRQPRRKPRRDPSEPRRPKRPKRRPDPEGEDDEPSRGGRVDILASTLEGVGSIRSARAPAAGPVLLPAGPVVFPPEGGGLSICKASGSKLPPGVPTASIGTVRPVFVTGTGLALTVYGPSSTARGRGSGQ